MSHRSLILGALLGLCICGFTYYNDQIIRQTYLIGNHLPASVFGIGILLLVAVNPLLRHWGERSVLKPGEIAVILAMGLAGCAWPGSNLMRYFSQVVALPPIRESTETSWRASRVMSYVPGGSPMLAEGFVSDYGELVRRLAHAPQQSNKPAVRRFYDLMPPQDREMIDQLAAADHLEHRHETDVTDAINRLLLRPDLYDARAFAGLNLSKQVRKTLESPTFSPGTASASLALQRANRRLLDMTFADLIQPPPPGSGVLLQPQDDPTAAQSWLNGREGNPGWQPWAVPWRLWWPVIRLWGGFVLLIGLATLCLMMVVHPQWSQRELLPYPTVEFVSRITQRDPGSRLPAVLSQRMFWIGFLIVAAVHMVNGLHEWFSQVPFITRQFDFGPLRSLFPTAMRVYGSEQLMYPILYPCVIGFGFLINTRVSMSLGLSLPMWLILGSWTTGLGVAMNTDRFQFDANGTALRWGAYFAATAVIAYSGRRYYLRLLAAALGRPHAEVPGYAPWAARGLVVACAAAVILLMVYTGIALLPAALLVLSLLMMFLVLARINAETGLFYAQPDCLSAPLIAGLVGVQALGPQTLIVLSIAGIMAAADPRETLAPYLLNGLHLNRKLGNITAGRSAKAIAPMLVIGLIVAVVVTLTFQYQRGANASDGWSSNLGIQPFNQVSSVISDLSAQGELHAVTAQHGSHILSHLHPDPSVVRWLSLGALLLLVCAVARMRLPWWPLHPVLFLVWGTYPANFFAVSFLLAGVIKAAVVRMGGERHYQRLYPLAIGLIAGDLLMILFWSIVGIAYYLHTGNIPHVYRILPS